MMIYLAIVILGTFAGFVSGIIGTGGSIILLPILSWRFGPQVAVPIRGQFGYRKLLYVKAVFVISALVINTRLNCPVVTPITIDNQNFLVSHFKKHSGRGLSSRRKNPLEIES